jgi:hypothetical protein
MLRPLNVPRCSSRRIQTDLVIRRALNLLHLGQIIRNHRTRRRIPTHLLGRSNRALGSMEPISFINKKKSKSYSSPPPLSSIQLHPILLSLLLHGKINDTRQAPTSSTQHHPPLPSHPTWSPLLNQPNCRPNPIMNLGTPLCPFPQNKRSRSAEYAFTNT